jgi:hypothetical protein
MIRERTALPPFALSEKETPMATANGVQTPSRAVIPVQPGTIFNAGSIVETLQSLMVRVTQDAVTAETVLAACRCASEISQILRLQLEAEKLRREEFPDTLCPRGGTPT